jgi:hypothetical protein
MQIEGGDGQAEAAAGGTRLGAGQLSGTSIEPCGQISSIVWRRPKTKLRPLSQSRKSSCPAGASGSADSESSGVGDAVEDFASSRLDDQDPLNVLIAKAERQERSDELERAIRDVRRTRDNLRIRDADWWIESALSEWEKSDWEQRQGGKTRGCGE